MLAAVIVLATVAGILAIAIIVSIVYDLRDRAPKSKAPAGAKPQPGTPPRPQAQPNKPNRWNNR